MPKLDFVPTCRYGHGDLKPVNGDPGFPGAFSLGGMNLDGDGKRIAPTGSGLLLDVYECPACGYTELFELQQK